MAALARTSRISSRLANFFQRNSPRLRPHTPAITWCTYSSTSKKVNQSEFVTGKRTEIDPSRVDEIFQDGRKEPSLSDPDDPSYVNHGFHEDAHTDLWSYRVIFFAAISIAMVIGPLYVHYLPESDGKIWARRQADFVIEERRKKGLPLIAADLCDPDKLVLPSAEEEERVWKIFRG